MLILILPWCTHLAEKSGPCVLSHLREMCVFSFKRNWSKREILLWTDLVYLRSWSSFLEQREKRWNRDCHSMLLESTPSFTHQGVFLDYTAILVQRELPSLFGLCLFSALRMCAWVPKARLGQIPPATLRFLARLAFLLGFVCYILKTINYLKYQLSKWNLPISWSHFKQRSVFYLIVLVRYIHSQAGWLFVFQQDLDGFFSCWAVYIHSRRQPLCGGIHRWRRHYSKG